MTSVVISERFGGFGLSDEAIKRIEELGTPLPTYSDQREIARDNPHLVQAVRELGDAANTPYSNLVVIEIPDHGVEWHVHEYDGYETLHEDHRAWNSDGETECT